MICQRCRQAADRLLPEEAHCAAVPGPGAPCDCQHRTERSLLDAIAVLDRASARARALHEQHRQALPARLAKIAEELTAQLPDDVRAAGLYLTANIAPEET